MEQIGIIKGDYAYLGCTSNGFCFKDENAFKTKTGICYIPEFGVDENDKIETSYTYNDLYEMCENNELVINLFETLDWQHPETLLEEWNLNEII